MARINGGEVKEIFDTDLTPAELNPFVITAGVVVDTHLASKGLSADILVEIEKYLAAHFATLLDPRAKTEKVGNEYSVTYQGETGMRFEATHYGQMALVLDSSNTLASLGQKRASMTIFRTPRHGSQIR